MWDLRAPHRPLGLVSSLTAHGLGSSAVFSPCGRYLAVAAATPICPPRIAAGGAGGGGGERAATAAPVLSEPFPAGIHTMPAPAPGAAGLIASDGLIASGGLMASDAAAVGNEAGEAAEGAARARLLLLRERERARRARLLARQEGVVHVYDAASLAPQRSFPIHRSSARHLSDYMRHLSDYMRHY